MRTLILAAILAALTACAWGGSDASDEPDLALELADFMLAPSDLTVSGPTVAIEVSNAGPTPHNLTIRDAAGEPLAATTDLGRGETETLTVDLAPGTYTIFCALPGHESLGMRGVLTVEAP